MQTTHRHSFLEEARRYWQMSLVRGVLALLAGVIIVCWPRQSFLAFFYVFGIFALIEGGVLVAHGFRQLKTFSEMIGPGISQKSTLSQSGARTQDEAARQRATHERGTSSQGGASAHESIVSGIASSLGTAPYMSKAIGQGGITQVVLGVASAVCGILCLILPGIIGALVVYVVAAWAMFRGIGSLMQIRERGWTVGVIGVLAIIVSLFLFINPVGAIRTFLWGVGVFLLIVGILQVVRSLRFQESATSGTPPLEPTY